MAVALAKLIAEMPTTFAGRAAQTLALPASGVLAFPAAAPVPADPATSPYIQFPASWAPVSDSPGIRVIMHNLSAATPIQPYLLNADGSIFATFNLLEPGGGWTSAGILNETAAGVPASALKLALRNIVTGDAAGFSVYAKAWAV